MKKYLVPTIGAIAFAVGGLIARSKTIDAIETLSKEFHKS